MADRKLTVKWLKNHIAYSWWKYALIAALCWLGVDMLFAMTAYRPPEERKLELYVLNDFVTTDALQADLWPELQQRSPTQEELTVLNINIAGDDIYAYMQFSTYVTARQGDVCLMPRSEVVKLTAEGADGAFTELTPYIESGVIDPKGIDLSGGRFKSEAGEEGLYAIPADDLLGLAAYSNDPADSFLVMLAYGGNDDNAAMLMDLMIEKYYEEPAQEEKTPQKTLQNPTNIF